MAFSAVVGNLAVQLGLDSSGLREGVSQAQGQLGKLDQSSGLTAASFVKLGVAAVAAAATMATAMVGVASEVIDSQSKMARQIGGSIEGLQALARAADLAGVSGEELSSMAERLNRRLGSAIRDSMSDSADALKRLGLNARELSNMDVDTRFGAIADAIKTSGINTQQAADLMGQLGIRSSKVLSLMEDGSKAFKEAKEDIRLFGVAVSTVDGKSVERANDAVTVFGLAARGLANQLTVGLSPVLEEVAEGFRTIVKESGGLQSVVQPYVRELVVGLGVVPSSIHSIRLAWDELVAFILNGINTTNAGIRSWLSWMPSTFTSKFEEIEHTYGNLRAKIGEAPTQEEWGKWFDSITTKATIASITLESIAKRMGTTKPSGGDELSSKERKAQEEKFVNFQKDIANEETALTVTRQKRLNELMEFNQKNIGTETERSAALLAIDQKYQQDRQDLVWSKVTETTATELEILAHNYAEKLDLINRFEQNHTLTVEQAEAARLKLIKKNSLATQQTVAAQWTAVANVVDTAMSNITSIMSDESQKGFTIMKAISMATALVKGYEAVVSAYAAGSRIGGPVTGAIFAGIAAAGVAAQIAKLAGVGSSSTGTVSAASSTSSTAAATESASSTSSSSASTAGGTTTPSATQHSMVVQGLGTAALFTNDAVRDLAEKLLQFQRDGGVVILE